mgnify:CR=1 FL=1
MTKIIFPANAADWLASPQYNNNILDLGNSGTWDAVGAVVVQFSPDVDFAGSFAVVGRVRYQSETTPQASFIPVPYIAVNVDGAAVLRTLTTDVITGPGIIEIPANGLAAGLAVLCSAGSCRLSLVRLAGTVNGNVPAEV